MPGSVLLTPLTRRSPAAPFARRAGETISVGRFCADVEACAERLPAGRHAINVCEDRYAFMVTFFAVIRRGATNLLPAQRAPDAIADLVRDHRDSYVRESYVVTDEDAAGARARTSPCSASPPEIAADHVAAIAFTSGSTGTPELHAKTWLALATAASMHAGRLGADVDVNAPRNVVATAPPWHMYGLEWSMLIALGAELTICCDPVFYPEDIRQALEGAPAPRVLVSMPVHLRALMRSGLAMPRLETVVSATAPLDTALARAVETASNGRVLEIYGCSEAGTLAYRYPTRAENWRFFDAFSAARIGDDVVVTADFLPAAVTLADVLEFVGEEFVLHGRRDDRVKVGGRLVSLSEVTERLLALDGVDDGVVVSPAALGLGESDRLAAFVVTTRSAEEIRRELARRVDASFVPRPIVVIDALPRAENGKLPREALTALAVDVARSSRD